MRVFLWMRTGDGLRPTRRLWRDFALKVLPGAFLTQAGMDGSNDGETRIRVALVHDPGPRRGSVAARLGSDVAPR
jgi:hypothetical protein